MFVQMVWAMKGVLSGWVFDDLSRYAALRQIVSLVVNQTTSDWVLLLTDK